MSLDPILSFSIVSHGQGLMVSKLLFDFRMLALDLVVPYEIVLTLNIPEDESFLSNFHDLPLKVLRNGHRQGFGENHNCAFAFSVGSIFAIVNPDIRINEFNPKPMIDCLALSEAGAWAPVVLSGQGKIEDSARRFPSLYRLSKRVVLRQRGPDYKATSGLISVDWVAGMFIAFTRPVFASVQGFDQRYFMYMEDADICRRLGKRGLHVYYDPTVNVVHDAQRATGRSLTHLRWHIRSAIRFIFNH